MEISFQKRLLLIGLRILALLRYVLVTFADCILRIIMYSCSLLLILYLILKLNLITKIDLGLISYHISESNGISYGRAHYANYKDFVDTYSGKLGIQYEFKGSENIPKTGRVIVFANHAGAYEEEFICNHIDQVRGKIGAKYLTFASNHVPRALGLIMSEKDRERLIPGAREIIQKHLEKGDAMVIFPAGVIENKPYWVDFLDRYKVDRNRFKSGIVYIAIQNECDVLPVYVDFKQPIYMCIISLLSPKTYAYLCNMFKSVFVRNKIVRVRFGKSIKLSDLRRITDQHGHQYAADSLRAAVYSIGDNLREPGIEKIALRK